MKEEEQGEYKWNWFLLLVCFLVRTTTMKYLLIWEASLCLCTGEVCAVFMWGIQSYRCHYHWLSLYLYHNEFLTLIQLTPEMRSVGRKKKTWCLAVNYKSGMFPVWGQRRRFVSPHITFCNYLFNYLHHPQYKIVRTYLEDREHGAVLKYLAKGQIGVMVIFRNQTLFENTHIHMRLPWSWKWDVELTWQWK